MSQSNDDLTLAMRLYADATRFVAGLETGDKALGRFVSGAKGQLIQLKNEFSGVRGALAGIGVTFGATAALMESARLDKSMGQIALAAGEGVDKTRALRLEMFRLSHETGKNVDDLTQGFANLVSSGLNWKEALQVIQATAKASTVTGTPIGDLTPALSVAADAYKLDLSKPGAATTLLDRITVASRLGNTETDNMAQIMSIVGQRAANVHMTDSQTLGLVAALSHIERRPRALTGVADSLLNVFTELPVMAQIQNSTGVRTFQNGMQRNPLDVLKDLRVQYARLKTDADKGLFMNMAFKGVDTNTQLILRKLLAGDALDNVNQYTAKIVSAAGTLDKGLGAALDNNQDQVDRLKGELREAGDAFAQPVNDAISGAIKFALDDKKNGGLGLNGMQIAGGGALLLGGTYLAAKFGGNALGALGRTLFGTGVGVAEGKLLQQTAGVTPVFVVNMPGGGLPGGGGGLPGLPGGVPGLGGLMPKLASRGLTTAALAGAMPIGDFMALGPAAMATAAGGVALAGALGYGAGTLATKLMENTETGTKIQDAIGSVLVHIGALFGDDQAQGAIDQRNRNDRQKGVLHVLVDDKRTSIKKVQSPFDNMDMDVAHGTNMGVFG